MARMYEMNLIIRLQDRASARMRRISGDMSALSRHAQAQNKLMQMQGQSQREQMRQGQALSTLRAMDNKSSSVYQRNLSSTMAKERAVFNARNVAARSGINHYQTQKWLSEKTTDIERKRMHLNDAQRAKLKSIEAALAAQLSEEYKIAEVKGAQNRVLDGSIAREKALNKQIAQRAVLEARGNVAARSYTRGRAVAHAGSLAFMGGAVTTGLAGLAASSYAKFDVQAAKAATQVGSTNFVDSQLAVQAAVKQTQAAAKELEKTILGMAREFPATAEEMATASYNIFSSMDLGNTVQERMKNGMAVLKEANKAAVGGQVDLATATDTLITVFNDFDPRLGSLHKNMAQLFAIVRFMRGGFEELNAGMNKLAPAARQARQSLLEVGASFAIITQAIPSAAQASTAEARLLQMFGTENFIAGMKKMKQEVTYTAKNGTQQLIPMFKIMDKILKVEPSLAAGGPATQTFMKRITDLGSPTGRGGSQGTIFQQRAFSVLVTEHPKHRSILKQMRKDVVEYDKSVQTLSEASGVKWKIAMNQLKVAWIQFGQTAMPILLAVLDKFTKLLDKFNNMSAGSKNIIATLVVIVGLLATVGGLFGSAFGGSMMLLATIRLAKVQKALEAIETGATSATTKVTALSRVTGALALLARGGIVIAVTYLLIKKWKKESRGDVFASFDKSIKNWSSDWKTSLNPIKPVASAVASVDAWMRGRDLKHPLASSVKERQKIIDEAGKNKFGITNLKKANDIAAAADAANVKYSKSRLDYITKVNAAAKDQANKLIAYEKKVQKARTEAAQAGKTATESMLKTMEAFMVAKEQEFRSTNKQGMDLFGGPMTGITGIFSDINTQLASYGIKPIPVPVKLILDAQDFQVSQFEDWRAGLDTLKKKLGPGYNKMVLELQSQGVASNPLVQSMLKATPAELKRWKTNWDKMQADIEAATQADIQTLKDLWATYPKDVVARIMTGLQSEEGTLSNGYRQYLVGTYPAQIAAEYGKAYNESLSNWFASNPPPKPPPLPKSPKAPKNTKANAGATAANSNGYPWATDTPFGITEEMYKRNWNYLGYSKNRINGAPFYGNPNLVRKNVVGPPAPLLPSKKDTSTGGYLRDVAKDYAKLIGIGYARGGLIPGSSNRDTVPAMLTPGEVVLNKRQIKNAAQMLGTANHPQAVFNKVQHYAKGGVAAAQNYKGMKGVSIQMDPKTGAIFAVNSKGVVYRTFKPGQPGYKQLVKQGMTSQVVTGHGGWLGLLKDVVDVAKSFTPHGIAAQAKGVYGQFRHPLAALYSGGTMMYPGGKPHPTAKAISNKADMFAERPMLTGEELRKSVEARRAAGSVASKVSKVSDVDTPLFEDGTLTPRIVDERRAAYKARVAAGTDKPLKGKAAIEKAEAGRVERTRVWRTKHSVIAEKNMERIRGELADAKSNLQKLTNQARKTSDTLSNLGYTSNLNEVISHAEASLIGFKPKPTNMGEFLGLVKALNKAPESIKIDPNAGFRPGSLEAANEVMRKFVGSPDRLTWDEALGEVVVGGKPLTYSGKGTVISQKLFDALKKSGTVTKAQRRIGASEAAKPSKRVSPFRGKKRKEGPAPERVKDSAAAYKKARAAMSANITTLIKDETGTVTPGGFRRKGKLPAQDLFSEIGRVEAKKILDKLKATKPPKKYATGGWVKGSGNRDNTPAWLTPGEYVVSKPMIRDLTSRKANAAAPITHVTHEQNINVDVTNPTGKAILDALKPVLFALRHQT